MAGVEGLHPASEAAAEAESATTVVAHVSCDAIVGGLASIVDRPQTVGPSERSHVLENLMLTVGSGRSGGWAAG